MSSSLTNFIVGKQVHFRTCRSKSDVNVTGSRSRSRERNYM